MSGTPFLRMRSPSHPCFVSLIKDPVFPWHVYLEISHLGASLVYPHESWGTHVYTSVKHEWDPFNKWDPFSMPKLLLPK